MAPNYTNEFYTESRHCAPHVETRPASRVRVRYYEKRGNVFVLHKTPRVHIKLPGGVMYTPDKETGKMHPINIDIPDDPVSGSVDRQGFMGSYRPTSEILGYKNEANDVPDGVDVERLKAEEQRKRVEANQQAQRAQSRPQPQQSSQTQQNAQNQYKAYDTPEYGNPNVARDSGARPAYREPPAPTGADRPKPKNQPYTGPINNSARFSRQEVSAYYKQKHRGFLGYYVCIYCGKVVASGDIQIDHICPVAATEKSRFARNYVRLMTLFRSRKVKARGVNGMWNLGPACPTCNRAKSERTGIWWVRGILGRVVFPVVDAGLFGGLAYGIGMAMTGSIVPLYVALCAVGGFFAFSKLILVPHKKHRK